MSASIVELARPLLVVEDSVADRELFTELLFQAYRHQSPQVLYADSCEQALDIIKQEVPSCCLVDYRLPEKSGLEFLKNIRLNYQSDIIPVIVMTGEGDERVAVEMMRNGAQDYLIKNDITPQLLARSIMNAIHNCQLQDKLRHLAHYDSLTGLLNRSLFMDRLQKAMADAERYQQSCSLLFIDVDDFKTLNDSYGHQAGDIVLKTIADRIKLNCRATDSASRFGGDEFAVLLDRISLEQTSQTAEKILGLVSEPIPIGSQIIQVSLSIGVSHYPESAKNIHDFIKQADEAMYRAKRDGKSVFRQYNNRQQEKWERVNHLERLLPEAIANNELSLDFQPIVKIENKSLRSLEVLTRWYPQDYEIPPVELIEMIERLGLFDSFHVWLINAALSQLSLWQAQQPELQLCINIPANQCHSDLFHGTLKRALKNYDVQPHQIELEITETTLMRHPKLSEELLESMRKLGVSVAIDDFGAGYTSMTSLTSLPIDTLKIDQGFLLDIQENAGHQKVIEALVLLGHSLGLKVIAEGVETEEQYQYIKNTGCDFAQGFYFSRPLSGEGSWNQFSSKIFTKTESVLM